MTAPIKNHTVVGSWQYAVGDKLSFQGKEWIVKKQAFIGADDIPCYFCETEGQARWINDRDLKNV